MTSQLLLGTKNRGKIVELRDLLRGARDLHLLTLADHPFSDVDESGETFLENALLKARSICSEAGMPVLAEDAGLEVAALGGAPGVRSARFSGEPADYARNNALLLEKLRGVKDRRARFVAVSALWLPDGEVFVTSGVLTGRIAATSRGSGGFGYDPLFVPEGETRTLAEISTGEKNLTSHRAKSMARMTRILESLIEEGALAPP
jgi:XTP/dITP diphosphohydrolase